MSTAFDWDMFGVPTSLVQDAEDAPKTQSGDDTDRNREEMQDVALERLVHAQEWMKDVLDRAKTEFETIIGTFSSAVGLINAIMGWDNQENHV